MSRRHEGVTTSSRVFPNEWYSDSGYWIIVCSWTLMTGGRSLNNAPSKTSDLPRAAFRAWSSSSAHWPGQATQAMGGVARLMSATSLLPDGPGEQFYSLIAASRSSRRDSGADTRVGIPPPRPSNGCKSGYKNTK